MKNQLEARREATELETQERTDVVFSDDEFEISVHEVTNIPRVRGVLAE